MKIHIEALELCCIIGLLDFERETEQRVILDVLIEYTYHESATFLNYADIRHLLVSHLKQESYLLLEEALIGMKELLFHEYSTIEKLSLKITKPDILDDCIVALSDQWDQ